MCCHFVRKIVRWRLLIDQPYTFYFYEVSFFCCRRKKGVTMVDECAIHAVFYGWL